MELEFENNVVIAKLDQNLSVTNSEDVKQKLYNFISDKKVEMLIFDCKNLTYVSSAGLRVILEFGKKYTIRLVDVSRDVYEILEVSGFAGIFEVRKALREVSVKDCPLVGAGASSRVYRYSEDTMIKVFLPGVDVERIYAETQSAKKSFMAGIPTGIPYDIVKCDGNYATVFEMINGVSLNTALMENPNRFDELTEKYANLMKHFHSIKTKEDQFPDVREKYHKWLESLKTYMDVDEVEKVLSLFDCIPHKVSLLHIDPHGGNIIVSGNDLMFIDMADISIGHPLIDLGTEYFHYMILPYASLGAKLIFGVEPKDKSLPERIFARLETLYFQNKTDLERQEIHKLLKFFGGLRCLVLVSKHPQLAIEDKMDLIEMQRKDLLEHIGEAKILFKNADKFFN